MLASATMICAASLSLAACSGGGSMTSLPTKVAQTPGKSTTSKAGVTLVLKIPARTSASAKRSPKYISASTVGAKVAITVNAATATSYFDLASGSPICTTASDGSATCTLAAPMPGFGTATIGISLYDEVTASGYVASGIPNSAALLSSGTIGATVTEGASTVTVPVILSGVMEGVHAVSTGSLTSGAAPQTTFIVEATDADGNVILASDGVISRTGGAVALTLTSPNSIAGVSMQDVTQTPGGSYSTSILGVKIGDTISIATTAATPQIVGVPVFAILPGSPPVPVGQLRIPATYTTTVPNSVPTTLPYPINEIAGVPAWATIDGSTQGGGFLYVDSGSPNQSVGSVSVSATSHFPTSVLTCNFYGTGITVDHIAQGAYATSNIILGEHTGVDALLSTLASMSCPNGTQDFSAASQGLYTTGTSITDVADDGRYAGGALVVASGGTGSSFIVTAPDGGTVSGGGNLVVTGTSEQAIDSLHLFYSKALVLETALGAIAYRNPSNFIQSASLGTPETAAALDDAGNVYILDTAGALHKCTLATDPSLFTCTFLANLASPTNYAPSTDHRALAIGADGNVWVAAQGLLSVNSTSGAVTRFGTTSYKEVVASGDGHLYLLTAGGTAYNDFP